MIRVVYLLWKGYGPDTLRRFVDSYRKFPAGMDHRLVIVWREFTSDVDRTPYRQVLAGIDHENVDIPELTYDYPAYFRIGRSATEKVMCCMVTTSTLLGDQWLTKLHAGMAYAPLVGVCGSWESRLSVEQRCAPRGGLNVVPSNFLDYPPFPNPHVRTSAFMVDREWFLKFDHNVLYAKEWMFRHESGRGGFSDTLRAQGCPLLICGRDGRLYRHEEWLQSNTYKSGDQGNLLISDKQTDAYYESDPARRQFLEAWTWRNVDIRRPV